VADRLLHPVELPAEAAADPLPRWRWLLGQLDEGILLTQAGNLSRAFARQNASRFGWDLSRPPRTETELYDPHQLRCRAGELAIARRALGLLALGSDWPDRRYELTLAGTATAREALRARATGPRTLT